MGTSSSPALFEGTLYVGNDGLKDIFFYAFRTDGTVRWRFPVPKQIFSSPAVKDGVVFFHVRDDHIYALNTQDGELVWKHDGTAPILVAPTLTGDAGTLLVTNVDDLAVALDADTGELVWQYHAKRDPTRHAELTLFAAPK